MVPVTVVAFFLQLVVAATQRYLPRDPEVRRAFAKEIRRLIQEEHVIPLEPIR